MICTRIFWVTASDNIFIPSKNVDTPLICSLLCISAIFLNDAIQMRNLRIEERVYITITRGDHETGIALRRA